MPLRFSILDDVFRIEETSSILPGRWTREWVCRFGRCVPGMGFTELLGYYKRECEEGRGGGPAAEIARARLKLMSDDDYTWPVDGLKKG